MKKLTASALCSLALATFQSPSQAATQYAEADEVSVTFSLVQSVPGRILKGGNTDTDKLSVVKSETEKGGTTTTKWEAKKVDTKIGNAQIIKAALAVYLDEENPSVEGWKIEAAPTFDYRSLEEISANDQEESPDGRGTLSYSVVIKSESESFELAQLTVGPLLTFKGTSTSSEKDGEPVSSKTTGAGTYANQVSLVLNDDFSDAEGLQVLKSLSGIYTGGVSIQSYATDTDNSNIKDGVIGLPSGGKIAVAAGMGSESVRCTGSISFGKSKLELKQEGGEDLE